MRKGLFLTVLTAGLIAAWAVHVATQTPSLAEVAKAEEARRKEIKNSRTKVYTNDDLKGHDTSAAPSAPAPAGAWPASPEAGKPGAPETAKPGTGKPEAGKPEAPKPETAKPDPNAKDEKYWKGRVAGAQQALDRNKLFADSLQTRINSLTTDFVNMDDPAKRAGIEQQRKTALAELERVKKEIDTQTKEIADIHEEARKANVPPGWLR